MYDASIHFHACTHSLHTLCVFNILCLVLCSGDALIKQTGVLSSQSFSCCMDTWVFIYPYLYSTQRPDLTGKKAFCPFPLPAAYLECEMMAGTPAAILEHKVTLRMETKCWIWMCRDKSAWTNQGDSSWALDCLHQDFF